MKICGSVFVLISLILTVPGCATRYIGSGLDDFQRSSKLTAASLTGVYSALIDEDMALRAENSVSNASISAADLAPVIVSFDHLQTRKELVNCLVEYSKLLKVFFEKDHGTYVREYGEDLEVSLSNLNPMIHTASGKRVAGVLSTIITMAPEGVTFLKKKKFALQLMREMQPVIEEISNKITEELNSVKLLLPNLYTRLFKLQVENHWPEKRDKRLKFALTGTKILRRKAKLEALTDDILKVMKLLPEEHLKLANSFRRGGGALIGLSELLEYSVRLKNNFDRFTKGD